jgi:hypothetical protein
MEASGIHAGSMPRRAYPRPGDFGGAVVKGAVVKGVVEFRDVSGSNIDFSPCGDATLALRKIRELESAAGMGRGMLSGPPRPITIPLDGAATGFLP